MTDLLNSPVVSAAYTINDGGPQDLTVTPERDGGVCLTFSTEDTSESYSLTPAEADALAETVLEVRRGRATALLARAETKAGCGGLSGRIRSVLDERGWVAGTDATDVLRGIVKTRGPNAGQPVNIQSFYSTLDRWAKGGEVVKVQTNAPGRSPVWAMPDRVDECRAHFGITVEAG